MTHKLGKELTFCLIYIEDWSIFSTSNPLFFDLQPKQILFTLINSDISPPAPQWSHYPAFWGQQALQFSLILASPLSSIPTLTSVLKLFIPENPLAQTVTPQKHTLSSAFQDTSPNLLEESTLYCSSYRALKLIFSLLLLSIQGRHLLWKCPIPLFMIMPAAPGIRMISSCISPRFLFSIVRQYTGLFLIDHIFWRRKLHDWKRMAGEWCLRWLVQIPNHLQK